MWICTTWIYTVWMSSRSAQAWLLRFSCARLRNVSRTVVLATTVCEPACLDTKENDEKDNFVNIFCFLFVSKIFWAVIFSSPKGRSRFHGKLSLHHQKTFRMGKKRRSPFHLREVTTVHPRILMRFYEQIKCVLSNFSHNFWFYHTNQVKSAESSFTFSEW